MSLAIPDADELPSIVYGENLRRHCEVAALVLAHLDNTSQSRHYVREAIRQASHQVSEVRGGTNRLKAKWMSAEARVQMESGDASRLVAEHTVPVSVILDRVMKGWQADPTVDFIERLVRRYSMQAVITQREDALLKEKNLLLRMPADWDGADLHARYRLVGIELEPNRYAQLAKWTRRAEAG